MARNVLTGFYRFLNGQKFPQATPDEEAVEFFRNVYLRGKVAKRKAA